MNYRKRGTCESPHIYQEHLGTRMTLLMQMLLERSDVLNLLDQVLIDIPGIKDHLERVRDVRSEALPVYHADVCAIIQHATLTPIPSIEVRLRDRTFVSVPVTPRWTPIMRRS